MVRIPDKVTQMMRRQKIIIVGSTNKKICNISPRTAFHVDQDGSLYWLELFRHKTLRNLQKNSWCAVAVFDKNKLDGYQLKGNATVVLDRKLKKEMSAKIIDKLTRMHKQRILKGAKKPNLVKFNTRLVFSLNPNELADSPLAVDADVESLKAADMQW
ncbi:MAG TPA: pyridoxamine 5'-phosphate oxidase family protein [Candidatus Nitrosotenuis sp.]|nr:pyridoxamine 5'-phosphate oxidase family protein [Candidatus Nitrosotenuis sp.]